MMYMCTCIEQLFGLRAWALIKYKKDIKIDNQRRRRADRARGDL
jgi:hypothetical protein